MKNAREQFERDADAFYRETGIMAPGKDVPAAMGDTMPMAQRQEEWNTWCAKRLMQDFRSQRDG